MRKFLKGLDGEQLFMRLFSCWIIACSFTMIKVKVGFDVLEFVRSANSLLFFTVMLFSFLLLTLLKQIPVKYSTDAWAFASVSLIFGLQTVVRNKKFYFAIGVIIALSLIGYYLLRDDKLGLGKIKFDKSSAAAVISAAATFFVLYVGGLTVLRYLNYGTSTYDFGIFSQMFYSMKETGLPITTCERNGELSHFAIHLSPIYYLLLPGYFIFPSPVYLQIMQALVVASGIIPLYLLARRYSLSYKISAAVCVCYALYPALAGSCFYDIHENMFLTPLLLWMFLFFEKEKWPAMYIFALLTCFVKEDAPIYVACFALFLILSRKKYKHGAVLFAGAVIYFIGAMLILKAGGHGAMTYRYNNFISNPDMGLISIFKTLIFDPEYLLVQVFSKDKMQYFITMLLPVASLPLLNRKYSQLVLVIPFLLINLMSNYAYQHSILFQYNFGTIAFFFYLVVINLSDLGPKFRRYAVPFMVTAAAVMFIVNVGSYTDNISKYNKHREEYSRIEACFDVIPQDASVQATGYFVPSLSNRDVIYDYDYNQKSKAPHKTEYIVFDLRPGYEKDVDKKMTAEKENGYTIAAYEEELVIVLHKDLS